uniref:Poly [ADP-ribose] polymerase n=1 Tax=Xiphophorus couchianus TaxID=32473 RepID=A0A3B5LL48_9TELE
MIGRVKLQLVCGDIVNAGTDVIVNTTNFTNLLTEDLICSTSAGQLGCKQIIHARFKGSTQRIRSTCKKILQLCESEGYGSVAFPAINTGLYKLLCVSLNTYLLTVGILLGEEKEKVKNFEQPHLSRPMTRLSKYNLQHGLQVIVYQGDITKQNADGIVNAANEDLNHIGGVAAALSKAGGPQVQKESRALVKGHGKIAVGDVVVTTGGDLKCKSLLHAVGPESGRASGRERSLLEKTVSNALKLAELMEFKSIALPCISSGIFAVPIKVCSEAIVTAIKEFGSQDGRSLSKIILIDKREEVVRAMQDACDRLLPGKDLGFKTNVADQEGASGATAETPVQVEIVELQPNSNEYQNVASDFLKTANLCRQRILAKNGQAELGEKSLYHGTSAESCSCIERDRFDRSYAGAHATAYGRGVYFAVHAEYSAKGFSPPDQSGMKRLYVARVVTGRYTLGSSSMRAPPARGADPTDCFDSLVNNRQQPTMFIVFHDDQAYPEYLITFR